MARVQSAQLLAGSLGLCLVKETLAFYPREREIPFLFGQLLRSYTSAWQPLMCLPAIGQEMFHVRAGRSLSSVMLVQLLGFSCTSGFAPWHLSCWPASADTLPRHSLFCLCLFLPLVARIAVIVICAVSALIVVVLSAVYTKRAIDRRLANVHVEEEVQVEEQHYLLGASSSREIDDEEARLADSSAQRGVMISVETPRLIVRRSRSSGDASKMQVFQGQLHQPLQQPLRTLASSPPGNWGSRFAQRLGFSSGSSKKVKAAEDAEDVAACSNHSAHPGSSTPPTAAVSSSNGSKTTCINRNGH